MTAHPMRPTVLVAKLDPMSTARYGIRKRGSEPVCASQKRRLYTHRLLGGIEAA